MKYLLDTNVISELIAPKRNEILLTWIESLSVQDIFISSMSIGEIWRGIEKLVPSKRKSHLETWFIQILLPTFKNRIVSPNSEEMIVWGSLVTQLEKQGKSMSVMDSLIASIALSNNLTLVTRNITDFQYTTLDLLNPWNQIS